MTSLKVLGYTAIGFFLSAQQAFANGECIPPFCGGTAVPEIDGAGSIIAIGLVAGLVALVRERFFRK